MSNDAPGPSAMPRELKTGADLFPQRQVEWADTLSQPHGGSTRHRPVDHDFARGQLHYRECHLRRTFRAHPVGRQEKPGGDGNRVRSDGNHHPTECGSRIALLARGRLVPVCANDVRAIRGVASGLVLAASDRWWRRGRDQSVLNHAVAFYPAVNSRWPRFFAIFLLVLVPATANYVGVRRGAYLGVIFTLAKLVPLGLVIGLGVFHQHKRSTSAEVLAPAWSAWPKVLLLLFYSFSGWEDTLVPSGEVEHPERTLRSRFSLAWGSARPSILPSNSSSCKLPGLLRRVTE